MFPFCQSLIHASVKIRPSGVRAKVREFIPGHDEEEGNENEESQARL